MVDEAADRLRAVYGATSDRELTELYDDWAASYDDDLRAWGYTYPPVVAGLVGRHVRDRKAPLLDAGCGTGLLGEVLGVLGHTHLVGIDLSEGMLKVARAKGASRELSREVLGQPLDFGDGHFGAVVSAGVLTTGHAPPDCLDELVRITRPGGHLIFTLSAPVLEGGGFAPKLEALTAAGAWREVEITAAWCALPGAPEESTLLARAYVFEAC
jgi:SAM-dependent methyltransferase